MGIRNIVRRVVGKSAQALLPARIRDALEIAWRRMAFRGRAARCPICESDLREFVPGSGFPRSVCPVCGSKGCHRLAWLYLERFTQIRTAPTSMLHIAPEACLRRRLSSFPGLRYVSCDIRPGVGDIVCDACRLPFPDCEFDIIYACHVINAMPDYRPALREMHRVLKPGGLAIPQVPVNTEGPTLSAADTEEDRVKQFGDPKIWRVFGLQDSMRDLEQAGFTVSFDERLEELPATERERYGLGGTGLVVGTKAP